MINLHSFHIPVMGIGYSIDTPLKVSHFGIDSVVSLVDDILMEKLRKMYCDLFQLSYEEITDNTFDYRAKRIRSYLNLLQELAEKKMQELKHSIQEKSDEIKQYFNLLPSYSSLKLEFEKLSAKCGSLSEIKTWLQENLAAGSIDVNILTKIDKDNFKDDIKLPVEFNDGHAAVRGYAQSNLQSSIILSSGLNPRLYGYLEEFDDFYPDENGYIKKKIVLKVSDFRSAFIQGKFLAKKGLWVSEFRVESGLNCGGHAFASDGFLLGPILEEFKKQRSALSEMMHTFFQKGLAKKNRVVPPEMLPIKLTAQGGIGTTREHHFLLDYYQLDSVGWGTPFLLVPQVTNVDDETMTKLLAAKENDVYLSNISPLGVPFNNLRGNSKDEEKYKRVEQGNPGSNCPKKYVAINNEFTERRICTASRQYQKLKLEQLKQQNLTEEAYKIAYDKIVEKACICVGLGTSALKVNHLNRKVEGEGVSICPGPNLAYFSKVMTLQDMTDHIYGRANMLDETDRPNFFLKELRIYKEFLQTKIAEMNTAANPVSPAYIATFSKNLLDGIQYYEKLFSSETQFSDDPNLNTELEKLKSEIEGMKNQICMN